MPSERLEFVTSPEVALDEQMVRAETAETMWAALGRLGPDERSMLVMHEVDGAPYDEIAAVMGLTVSAVKSKLYRARVALRSEVST